jgi:ABC-type amino acid transport substrate-binding protein
MTDMMTARRLAGLLLAASLCSTAAQAGPVLDRVLQTRTLRVCIWSDYYGVTYRNPRNQTLSGIDIELSREFAAKLGTKITYVESSFVKLIDNLQTDRCDIAMHAVGTSAERLATLSFSRPYLESDIYGVATRSSRLIKTWDDIDRPGVNVAVQAGSFIEPVMVATLKSARVVVVAHPKTREHELESGRVDVFMTDYPYSRRLLDKADWARLIAPPQSFHRQPKAYAVKRGDDDWLRTVNEFVAEIKRDGRLRRAADRAGLGAIVVEQ